MPTRVPHGDGDRGRRGTRHADGGGVRRPPSMRRRPDPPSKSAGCTSSARVGTQMTMKRTPRLTFRADPAIAAGSRVEELLRGLHEGESPGRRGVGPVRSFREPLRVSPAWWSSTRRPVRTSHDVVARCPPHLRPAPRWPRRDPRPRRHGRPAGRARPRQPAHALPHRAAQAVHDGHRAREHDVDARLVGRGPWPPTTWQHVTPDEVAARRRRSDGRDRPGAADGVGRQGRGAPPARAGPARASRWSDPPGPVTVRALRHLAPDPASRPGVYRAEVDCSLGHLHPGCSPTTWAGRSEAGRIIFSLSSGGGVTGRT